MYFNFDFFRDTEKIWESEEKPTMHRNIESVYKIFVSSLIDNGSVLLINFKNITKIKKFHA